MEKAIRSLSKKCGHKLTIRDINSYFILRAGWAESVAGMMFQDLPSNGTISAVKGFFYKKRIQLVVFDDRIVTNFIHRFDGEC